MDNQQLVCECKACTNLPEEEEKNDDGATVKKSFNDAPAPKHQNMYMYYCGRKLDTIQNYHNYCGMCDGLCGPNEGCQCKSCYRFQFDQKKEDFGVFFNGEGARVKKSMDNVHSQKEGYYCGRKVGPKCFENGCEECVKKGTCGPDNGCRCKSCYTLQNKVDNPKNCCIM